MTSPLSKLRTFNRPTNGLAWVREAERLLAEAYERPESCTECDGTGNATFHPDDRCPNCFETRPVDAAGREDADLPEILLSVSGDVFTASGTTADGIPWNIYAEAETQEHARARVSVDAVTVAQITVHPNNEPLTEEVQTVCAALVWSAIRAVRIKKLASSTGFSPPLVPEETENRVVPSGGGIGAPSGACTSIFGTPPELIPEGATEFVSDGFRALRCPGSSLGGGVFEVRTIGSNAWQCAWPNADYKSLLSWGGPGAAFNALSLKDPGDIAAAVPWLRYWLARADEPIERAEPSERGGDCDTCHGRGFVGHPDDPGGGCLDCNGSGEEQTARDDGQSHLLAPRPEVMWFARWMELKLRENDHKGGWERCDVRRLHKRAEEELGELEATFDADFTPENTVDLIREAADVANMVMMVADNASRNRLPEPGAEQPSPPAKDSLTAEAGDDDVDELDRFSDALAEAKGWHHTTLPLGYAYEAFIAWQSERAQHAEEIAGLKAENEKLENELRVGLPKGKPGRHWAVTNPGLADHYRHVADCAQKALKMPGAFSGEDDDVAPVDVGEYIENMRDTLKELSTIPDSTPNNNGELVQSFREFRSERDKATARAVKAEARVRELEAQRDASIHGRGKMMDELVADSDARITSLQSEVTRLTAQAEEARCLYMALRSEVGQYIDAAGLPVNFETSMRHMHNRFPPWSTIDPLPVAIPESGEGAE